MSLSFLATDPVPVAAVACISVGTSSVFLVGNPMGTKIHVNCVSFCSLTNAGGGAIKLSNKSFM